MLESKEKVGLQTLKESDEEHGHANRSRPTRREQQPVTILLARHTLIGKEDKKIEKTGR